MNVCCGMEDGYLIGSFPSKNRFGEYESLNFIQKQLPGLLEDFLRNIRAKMIFRHDGAPNATTSLTFEWNISMVFDVSQRSY